MTSYVRRPFVDLLGVDGQAIVLFENRFVRLGLLATWIVQSTEAPQLLESLAESLSRAFGEPAGAEAVDATRAALLELVAQDVMDEVEYD